MECDDVDEDELMYIIDEQEQSQGQGWGQEQGQGRGRGQGQGRGQRQGGDRGDKMSNNFMQHASRAKKMANSSGKESHPTRSSTSKEVADGKGFKGRLPIPGRGKGRGKEGNENKTLQNHQQYTSQRLHQISELSPSPFQPTFDTNAALFSDASHSHRPGHLSSFSPLEAISPITCPGYPHMSGKVLASNSTITPPDQHVNPYTDRGLLHNELFGQDMSVDETIEDCRVLSDEIAATLPSPVAVMFPFPERSNHPNNEEDADMDIESKEPTEDSVDDGKMCQYINTMATSIAADILKLRQKKLICTLEPPPLELLVRMPPTGATPPHPLATNIYPYF